MSGGVICLAVIGAVALYMMPAIIGWRRRLATRGALLFVNIVLGWTLIMWIVCMIWAATGATKDQDAFYKAQRAVP